jgi:chromosome segregation ATPase
MADEHAMLQNQIAELKQSLTEATEENAVLVGQLSEMDEKALSEKLEALQVQVQKRDETIASLEAAAETHDSEKQELNDKNQAATEQIETIQAKLDEIEAEAHKSQRLSALKDAGLTEEEAEAKLEAFSEASDELFAEVVDLLADRKPAATDEDTDETVTDESEAGAGPKKKIKNGDKVKKGEDSEDKDDADASADTESLEEVEEEVEAALADAGETDEVQSARAGASEWLRDHVLKSTAGLTEK